MTSTELPCVYAAHILNDDNILSILNTARINDNNSQNSVILKIIICKKGRLIVFSSLNDSLIVDC